MTHKIKYTNDSLELLGRGILWFFGFMFILPIPWVINDQIKYFSKGFTITSQKSK